MGITHEWNGTVLTITSDSGTSSADLKGEKGDTGIRGAQGEKGKTGEFDAELLDGTLTEAKAYTDTEVATVSAEAAAAMEKAVTAETIAKANRGAYVFDAEEQLNEWLADETNRESLQDGDSFYLRAYGYPCYFWNGTGIQAIRTQADVSLPHYVTYSEVDVIVESGTSDNGWYYEKYESGKAICSKHYTLQNIGFTTVCGGLYRADTDYFGSWGLPIDFTELPVESLTIHKAQSNITQDNVLILAGYGMGYLGASSAFTILSPVAIDNVPEIIVDSYIVGKWK